MRHRWLLRFAALTAVTATPSLRAQTDSARSPRPGAAGGYTEAQAARGQAVFRQVCSSCHVTSQFTTQAFRQAWTGRTAAEMFEQIRTTMPLENPGRLRRQEYADVLAYVFKLNALPAGEAELPADPEGLRRVRFQPPNPSRD